MKKAIISIITIILIGNSIITINAASTTFTQVSSVTLGTYSTKYAVMKDNQTGNYLYCVESGVPVGTSAISIEGDMLFNTETVRGLGSLLNNGFGGDNDITGNYGLSNDHRFFATQMAIHKFLYRQGYTANGKETNESGMPATVVGLTNELIRIANVEKQGAFANVTLEEVGSLTWNIETKKYEQKYKVVSNTNNVRINIITGSGTLSKTIASNGDIVIASINNLDQEFGISAIASIGVPTGIFWTVGGGTQQTMTEKADPFQSKNTATKTLTITELKGTYHLTKTDENDNALEGAVFSLYDSMDNLIAEDLTTDKNGNLVINDLKIDDYYLVETNAPVGYKKDSKPIKFSVIDDNLIENVFINERIKGGLEFTKTDLSTGETLPNTTISIYNELDEKIFEGVTDENGKIIIDELEYGNYYIIETNAPVGYILNPEKMFFSITEDGEIVKCTMTNEKIIMPKTGTYLSDTEMCLFILTIIVSTILSIFISHKKEVM